MLLLMDPQSLSAGGSNSHGYGCYRSSAYDRDFETPTFFSIPGNGRANIPYEQTTRESPYVPQQLVGLEEGRATGYQPLLSMAGDGNYVIDAATMASAAGPVDLRVVDGQTPTPNPSGYSFFRNRGVLIPFNPLQPATTYQANVLWRNTEDGVQIPATFSFTTAVAPPRRQSINAAATLRKGKLKLRVRTSANARGRAAKATFAKRSRGRWRPAAKGRTLRLARTARTLKTYKLSKRLKRVRVTIKLGSYRAANRDYLPATTKLSVTRRR